MTKKKHSDRASNYTAVQPLDFEPQNAKERGHLTFQLLLSLIGTEHLACPSIHVHLTLFYCDFRFTVTKTFQSNILLFLWVQLNTANKFMFR